MFNLIRMNLYRIFHTRSTYIMLAVIMVFAGFSAYMMREDIKMLEEEITAEGGQLNEAQTDEIVLESDDASTPLTIMVETPYHEDGTKPAFTEYLCADLRSGLILIILAIFPVLFVNSEEKSGFVKNIAGQTKRREWIYLSKTAGIMIFHLMAMAAYTIIHIATFLILHPGEPFGVSMFGQTARYMGVLWLLSVAFSSGMALLTTLLKSTAVSITVGILAVLGVGDIISGFFTHIYKIKISEYLLISNYKALLYNSAADKFWHALVVALAFLIGYNIIGSVVVRKRDVV